MIRELLGKMPSVDPGFSVCWQASSTHLDGPSVDEAVLDMKFMACDVHEAQQDQGLEFWR
jgi:hypothetical protein